MNESPSNPATQRGVAVRVRGLCKRLQGTPVLQDIDLDVAPGEIFVIMGPSGSGKSVLLRHLSGLMEPDAGEVLVGGQPVRAPELMPDYRLAMVFQSGALLNSLTVGENVGLFLREHRLKPPAEIARIVAEKLAVVGLKGQEHKLPAELSGGMKKRAAIARALVIDPQLILYDEPTSELDPVSASVIAEEIVRLQRRIGVTSIVVSHDRDLVFGIADRLAVISGGRILAVGTPARIRAHPNAELQAFLNVDFQFPSLKQTV